MTQTTTGNDGRQMLWFMQSYAIFSTAGATFSGGASYPTYAAGNYRFRIQGAVASVTGVATTVTLQSAVDLIAFNHTASRTLVAAATTLCEWDKGSPILAGDAFLAYSDLYALGGGESIAPSGTGIVLFAGYSDLDTVTVAYNISLERSA